MFRLIVSILFLFFNISFEICGQRTEPALLVISYDAFRPEYLNRGITPNLNKLRREGTSASYMLNVFPTKTLVNHFTMVTGLYPENHGVLDNKLYDIKKGKMFSRYDLFHYSDRTLPIWTANQKAGKHSGCMMWPGCGFKYQGRRATFFGKFNSTWTMENRVDVSLSWFKHKKTPANLVFLYIDQPDGKGHVYGTESKVMNNTLIQLDKITLYIQQKLIAMGLSRRVNVVHVSDHGMMNVFLENSIRIDEILANDNCNIYGQTPVLQIVPKDISKMRQVFAKLTHAAKQNGHFKVYNQTNIPARWHVNNTRLLGPILVVADNGYGFQDLMKSAKYRNKKFNIPISNKTILGVHGYDNNESKMHAIFIAKGPLFAKSKSLKPVNMIDLYNLFCSTLKIESYCARNNGSKRLANEVLGSKPTKSTHHHHHVKRP